MAVRYGSQNKIYQNQALTMEPEPRLVNKHILRTLGFQKASVCKAAFQFWFDFGTMPSSVQVLHLALCSGTISGGAWGMIYGAEDGPRLAVCEANALLTVHPLIANSSSHVEREPREEVKRAYVRA